MENELSRAIASADVKVRYDTQCKRVLTDHLPFYSFGA